MGRREACAARSGCRFRAQAPEVRPGCCFIFVAVDPPALWHRMEKQNARKTLCGPCGRARTRARSRSIRPMQSKTAAPSPTEVSSSPVRRGRRANGAPSTTPTVPPLSPASGSRRRTVLRATGWLAATGSTSPGRTCWTPLRPSRPRRESNTPSQAFVPTFRLHSMRRTSIRTVRSAPTTWRYTATETIVGVGEHVARRIVGRLSL